jgi:hypothetical protein
MKALKSVARGHHIYKLIWTLMEKKLQLKHEENERAVAVL